MGPELAAFAVVLMIEDGLEKGAEDGGRDFFPMEFSAVDEAGAHLGGEAGEVEPLSKEVAIDVGELGEVLVEIFLPPFFGGVEGGKKLGDFWPEVGAVCGGVVEEVELEVVRRVEAGVFGEEAEKDAGEEGAEFFGWESAVVEGVVQAGHELSGDEIGWIFGVEFVGFVARDEGEVADIFMEIFEGELVRGRESLEERELGVLLGFEVVDGYFLKVGDDEPAGKFLVAALVNEAADVVHALGMRFAEVLADRFVLDEAGAGPEEVNVAPVAGEFFYRFFERSEGATFFAENFEKIVPVSLALAGLRSVIGVIAGKGDGAAFDFIPTERHEVML